MMPDNSRILTINVGSSSIKFAVFETRDALRRVLEGSIERVGLPGAGLVMKGAQAADNFSRPVAAAGLLIDRLEERIRGDTLTAVGHRVGMLGRPLQRGEACDAGDGRGVVRVMRTDEEWMIAKTVCRVLGVTIEQETSS